MKPIFHAAASIHAGLTIGSLLKWLVALLGFGLAGCGITADAIEPTNVAAAEFSDPDIEIPEPVTEPEPATEPESVDTYRPIDAQELLSLISKEISTPLKDVFCEVVAGQEKILAAIEVQRPVSVPPPEEQVRQLVPQVMGPLDIPLGDVYGPVGCGACEQAYRFGNDTCRVKLTKRTDIPQWVANLAVSGYPVIVFKNKAGRVLYINQYRGVPDMISRMEFGKPVEAPKAVMAPQPQNYYQPRRRR